MKIKFYLWSLLTFVAFSLAAVGCSDDDNVNDVPDPVPPTPALNLALEVSGITAHGADLKVTPSDNNQTFYADIASAEMFKGQSDDALITMITSKIDLKDLKKGQIVIPASTMKLDAETDYVFFALGYTEDGKVTSKLAKKPFTTLKEEQKPDPEPEADGPTVEFTSQAGLPDGTMEEAAVSILVKCTSQDATDAAILIDDKGQVDEALKAEGASIEGIVDANHSAMQRFEKAWINTMNLKDPKSPEGLSLNLQASAGTKYTMLLEVKNGKGRTVLRTDCTTSDRTTKAEQISEEDFLKMVWNFNQNKEWKYEGNAPIVIDFFATWCGPCKMMNPIIDQCSFDYDGQVKFYQIDIEKAPKAWQAVCNLSQHDGAIPFFWFINAEGRIKSLRGATTDREFRKLVDGILDGAVEPGPNPIVELSGRYSATEGGIVYSMVCQSQDASYAAYCIAESVQLDKILTENQLSIQDIMDIPDNINEIPAEYIEAMNTVDGLNLLFDQGQIGNRYAMILDVQNDVFGRMVKRADATYEDVQYEEGATLIDTRSNGIVVHMEIPATVIEKGNAVRWNRACLPMYNMMKMQGAADAEFLVTNGGLYLTESTDIFIDEEHSAVIDPETGEEYVIGDPLCPGEPVVFMAGEFSWGESEYGWGEGYYNWLFDYDRFLDEMMGGGGMLMSAKPGVVCGINPDEAKYWTGYYQTELYYTKKPMNFEGDVKYEVVDITPIEATVRFTPDPSVKRYCVMFMDDPTYNEMLLPMLDNNTDYLQWFTTSYFAFMQMGVMAFEEPVDLNLSEWAGELEPGMKFQVCVVAMGDVDGSMQNYSQYEITMPERTMPAPVIKTTAIKNPNTGIDDPFQVWFNIKAVEGVVADLKFAANYERDFEYMLKNGYDYFSLVDQMGNAVSHTDLDKVNSPEGLNVVFDVRPYSRFILSAVGYNEERLGSEASWALTTSSDLPASERVESNYFNTLQGDWTASAILSHYDYSTSTWVADAEPTKFKISISNGVKDYPEVLPEEVYALYNGIPREEVDAMYQIFKERAEIYDTRLRQQNCLQLCGFGYDPKGRLDYKSPYDLFTSDTYSASGNEGLFEDFGPKWYLKVNADGSLSVPINVNFMNPLCAWGTQYGRKDTYYVVGMGETDFVGMTQTPQEKWYEFPVNVSADGNTVTILPIVHNNNEGVETNYYPSVMNYMQSFRPIDSGKIVSEITLTKGWSEPAPAQVNRHFTYATEAVEALNGAKMIEKNYSTLVRTVMNKNARPIKEVKSTQLVGKKFVAKMDQLLEDTKAAAKAFRGQKNIKRAASVAMGKPAAKAELTELKKVEFHMPAQTSVEAENTVKVNNEALITNIAKLPGKFL